MANTDYKTTSRHAYEGTDIKNRDVGCNIYFLAKRRFMFHIICFACLSGIRLNETYRPFCGRLR